MEPVWKSVDSGGHPRQTVMRPTTLCLDKRGPTVTMPCMHAVVEPQPLPAGCARQCGYLGMDSVDSVGQREAAR